VEAEGRFGRGEIGEGEVIAGAGVFTSPSADSGREKGFVPIVGFIIAREI
jgi:hypothetical protein